MSETLSSALHRAIRGGHMDAVKTLMGYGDPDIRALEVAIRYYRRELFPIIQMWTRDLILDPVIAVDMALLSGSIEMVKMYVLPEYLRSINAINILRHLVHLMEVDHPQNPEILAYIQEHNEFMSNHQYRPRIWSESDHIVVLGIVKCGNIELLKWAFTKFEPLTFCYAAQYITSLEIFKHVYQFLTHDGRVLLDNPTFESLFNSFVSSGLIDLVKYMKINGCPWYPSTFTAALSFRGNISMLNWLRYDCENIKNTNGDLIGICPFNESVYLRVLVGDIETLQWLKSACPYSSDTKEHLCTYLRSEIEHMSRSGEIHGPTGMTGPTGPCPPYHAIPDGMKFMYGYANGDEYGPHPPGQTYLEKCYSMLLWVERNM
jgi:hypothetical protein